VQATCRLHNPSQQRTTPRTTELCQPQTKNDSCGPHARIQGENAPGACWPRLEQDNPSRSWLDATGSEEVNDQHGRARVSRKLSKTTDLALKNITQKALSDRLRWRHPKNVNSPQPTTCEASVIQKKKTKKESTTEKNSIAQRLGGPPAPPVKAGGKKTPYP